MRKGTSGDLVLRFREVGPAPSDRSRIRPLGRQASGAGDCPDSRGEGLPVRRLETAVVWKCARRLMFRSFRWPRNRIRSIRSIRQTLLTVFMLAVAGAVPSFADDARTSADQPKTRGCACCGSLSITKATDKDQKAIKTQGTCPVSGEDLGSMGTPVKLSRGDKVLFVCCRGCVKKVQADPETYFSKTKGVGSAAKAEAKAKAKAETSCGKCCATDGKACCDGDTKCCAGEASQGAKAGACCGADCSGCCGAGCCTRKGEMPTETR